MKQKINLVNGIYIRLQTQVIQIMKTYIIQMVHFQKEKFLLIYTQLLQNIIPQMKVEGIVYLMIN